MQVEEGRPLGTLRPRGGYQDDPRPRADVERESRCNDKRAPGNQETQGTVGNSAAMGILARIRRVLEGERGAGPGTYHPGTVPTIVPANASPKAEPREVALQTRGSADPVAALRKENKDLRRQLAESQSRVRALKEELGKRLAGAQTGFAKPYKNVTDQDHEKIMAFIEKWKLDPGEEYDRALMGLAAKGDIKVHR